jgi:hypothetical protein
VKNISRDSTGFGFIKRLAMFLFAKLEDGDLGGCWRNSFFKQSLAKQGLMNLFRN